MRSLPYVGVVVLWLLTVAGVAFVVQQAFGFDDALLEGTRTPIPGERVLHLEARKYNLFFEADELHGSNAPPVLVRVEPLDSDDVPEVKDYSGSFTVSGSRDATAFATVRIHQAGRYRLVTSGQPPARFAEPAVVLGKPIGRRVLRLVGGVILTGAAFVGGLLVLIVTLVLRSRRRA